MEICMNKHSRMNFIYIEDVDDDHFLAVTPDCKSKILEFDFFSDSFTGEPANLLAQGLISASQINAYEQYNSNREHDLKERVRRSFEGWSKQEIQALIARYEKMKEKQKETFPKGDNENENV